MSNAATLKADNFFVPPLNLLSEKLKLSPSIAGITLLAIGNGEGKVPGWLVPAVGQQVLRPSGRH